MEDKKVLNNEQLEKITGGNDSVESFYIPKPYIYPSTLDIADTTVSTETSDEMADWELQDYHKKWPYIWGGTNEQ